MNWFGEHWGAPACETGEQVETPVGSPCIYCDDPIAADDQGFRSAMMNADGKVEHVAMHLDCMLRQVQPCQIVGDHCLTHERNHAVRSALRVMGDPTNRAVVCPCGVTYLSGAAAKDSSGKPICIACGEPARTAS